MAEFAAWVESTWISKTLFGITWLWPASESSHFIGLCMLIGGAGLLDLRLLGMFRGVPIRHVKALMPWAIGGFLINAVTGLLFLVMQPHLYLTSGVWWAKVAFLGLAGPERTDVDGDEGHRRPLAFQLVRGPVLRAHAAVSRHRKLIERPRTLPSESGV